MFARFFIDGGWLVWVVLLPVSLLTLRLIVQYGLALRMTNLVPQSVAERVGELLDRRQLDAAREYLQGDERLLSRVLRLGLAEAAYGRDAMSRAVAEMLEDGGDDMFRRIEWLNIIGNVAPMVGLFGTVWGMIEAFHGIVQAGGQPEPAELAGGISMALVTTWWGLIVAIPALAAFGFFRNRIDYAVAETAVIAEELLSDIPVSPEANRPVSR